MLDWLSNPSNPNPDPLSNTTFIPDGPETPAPVFAYRALRGILFGSPDDDSVVGDNKENVEPPPVPFPIRGSSSGTETRGGQARPIMTTSSPTKHTATTTQHGITRDSPLTSPARSKQLRSLQQSPAKSILRTPGVPTPRRRGTANVSFKDVRPSISPALVPKKPEAHGRPLGERDVGAAKSASETNVKTTRTAPTDRCEVLNLTKLKQQEDRNRPDTSALHAYMAKTEGEMRRLVRYNQKLKSYARRREEENGELRRENGRLKRALDEARKAALAPRTAPMQETRARAPTSGATHIGDGGGGGGGAASPGRPSTTESRDAAGRRAGRNATPTPRALPMAPEAVPEPRRVATQPRLPPDRLLAAKERLRVKSVERRRALSGVM